MKKKLALLLASAMIMAVPAQALAATGTLSGSTYPVINKTITFESGIVGTVQSATNIGADDISYIVDGQNLIVTLDKGYLASLNTAYFDVALDGAIWFFRNSDGTSTPTAKGASNGDFLNIGGATTTSVYNTVASGAAVAATIPTLSTYPTNNSNNFYDQLVKNGGYDKAGAKVSDLKAAYPSTYDLTKGYYNDTTATYYRYQTSFKNTLYSNVVAYYYQNTAVTFDSVNSKWVYANGNAFAREMALNNYLGATYEVGSTGLYTSPGFDAYTSSTDTVAIQSLVRTAATTYYGIGTTSTEVQVPYKLNVLGGNSGSTARVSLLPLRNAEGDIMLNEYSSNYISDQNKYVITIPLVYRASGNEVKVSITAGNMGVYLAATPLATGGLSRATTATIDSSATGRDRISLKDLRIAEHVAGYINGLEGGVIQLKAQTGFYFDNIGSIVLSLDGGLTWSSLGTSGEGKIKSDYFVANKLNNYLTTADSSTLYIYIPAGKIVNSLIPGAITIKKLELVADYNAPFDDVYLTISQVDAKGHTLTEDKANYNLQESFGSVITGGGVITPTSNPIFSELSAFGGSPGSPVIIGYTTGSTTSISTGVNPATKLGITTETIKVATRKDWTVTYKSLTDPIPELIAGRYSPALVTSTAGNLDVSLSQQNAGDEHKAAKVELSENALNAWWASRQTDFELPEGVKFRKVVLDAWTNISTTKPSPTTIIADGDRKANYTLDSSRFSLYSLTIKSGELAKISFTPYISISAGYPDSEVKMTFSNTTSGTSVNNEGIQSLAIATVVKPITVEVSEVKELKIGYQTFETGNVIIKETKAGMLQRGKELKVSVTDYITQDLYFAPIDAAKNVEVASDGYFAVKDIRNLDVNSNAVSSYSQIYGINSGTISMTIDRASVNEPATITLKDLYVKVSRDVPQSTINYEVVVWGEAVAANYGGERDQFAVPGISTEYVKVVSSASDQAVLTQEVRITIGEQYYLVEGKPVDLEAGAAAYVSADGATMVPLRFVSEAFGLTKDQILWDNNTKTATIIHPSRVLQFTSGSDRMLVNGSPVTMGLLGADGNYYAYKAEIPTERMFIPFRAIGEAFGVSVTWEEATKTAIYNAK